MKENLTNQWVQAINASDCLPSQKPELIGRGRIQVIKQDDGSIIYAVAPGIEGLHDSDAWIESNNALLTPTLSKTFGVDPHRVSVVWDHTLDYFPVAKERRIKVLQTQSRIPTVAIGKYTWESFKVEQSNTKAVAEIKRISDVPNAPSSCFICGAVGLGKTHIAVAIANQWVRQLKSVRYYQVGLMLDNLRAGYNKQNDESINPDSYAALMSDIQSCQLLILDDLGVQKNSVWAVEKLDTLIDYRYINQLPLIVTSNLSLSDIKVMSNRIASRLSDGIQVTLKGISPRGSRHNAQ